jgi:hypothetical protein
MLSFDRVIGLLCQTLELSDFGSGRSHSQIATHVMQPIAILHKRTTNIGPKDGTEFRTKYYRPQPEVIL